MDITLKNGVKVPVQSRRSVQDIIQRKGSVSPIPPLIGHEGRRVVIGQQENCAACGVFILGRTTWMCDECWREAEGSDRWVFYNSENGSPIYR